MADDNLLDPNEIDALLNSAGSGTPTDSSADAPAESQPPPASETPAEDNDGDSGGGVLDASEIDALLAGASSNSAGEHAEALLNQAEVDLATAVAPSLNPSGNFTAPGGDGGTPFEFANFGGRPDSGGTSAGMHALQDVELDLKIELGRTELLIEEVLKLKEGSVVPLDKLAGDPVDILVNGQLIARGEVLVLNDNFCVRVAEILTPEL